MNFCESCGKGPFPLISSLNKHIWLSAKCNRAAQEKRETSATQKWNDAPIRPNHPPETPFLDVDELNIMPDDNTLNDIPEEDIAITSPVPEMLHAEPERLRTTVEKAMDGDQNSAYFIDEFPANFGAGAVWGEEVPFFEKILQEQEESGSSRWGPFEDQDEWELAQWLIQNVGQNQNDKFLNLKIVGLNLCSEVRWWN